MKSLTCLMISPYKYNIIVLYCIDFTSPRSVINPVNTVTTQSMLTQERSKGGVSVGMYIITLLSTGYCSENYVNKKANNHSYIPCVRSLFLGLLS